jgi:hypothetical protein
LKVAGKGKRLGETIDQHLVSVKRQFALVEEFVCRCATALPSEVGFGVEFDQDVRMIDDAGTTCLQRRRHELLSSLANG